MCANGLAHTSLAPHPSSLTGADGLVNTAIAPPSSSPVQRAALVASPPTPAVGLWHMLSRLERRGFTSPTSSVHTRRFLVCSSHLHLIIGDGYHVSFGHTKIWTERNSNFKLVGPTERQAS
jgi:hypothetical protein